MKLTIDTSKIIKKHFSDIRKKRISLIRKTFRILKKNLRYSLTYTITYELGYAYDEFVAYRFISRCLSPRISNITLIQKESSRFASGDKEYNHIQIEFKIK